MANKHLSTKANPNRTIRTEKNREKILQLLASGEAVTLSDAAFKIKIGVRSLYEWKAEDEEFQKEIAEALEMGADPLEKVAYSHAKDGVDEPVFYEGEICGHIKKFDHGLLMRLIERRKPKAVTTAQAVNSLAEALSALASPVSEK